MHNRQQNILMVGAINKELKDINPATSNTQIITPVYLNIYVCMLSI